MKPSFRGLRDRLWVNRSLSARFTILLSAIFLLGASIGSLVLWPVLQARAEGEVASKGALLLEAMNAVRSYTNTHVVPLLQGGVIMGPADPARGAAGPGPVAVGGEPAAAAGGGSDAGKFIPESVPAYSAREVFSKMQESGKTTGFVYREVSLNPTNPLNRADEFESRLVQRMEGSTQAEYAAFCDRAGQRFYYVAHPMRMTSERCLTCHGDPAAAPASMIAQYGAANGFGWKMNSVIAAQIVYVPADEVLRAALRSFWIMVGATILTLGLVLLMLNVLLRRDIIRPVRTLGLVAGKLSADQPIADFPQSSDLTRIAVRADELGQTARLFRQMANEVYARTQSLKQRVQELRIEIDAVRRKQNVTEVVETDFFRDLQSRARALRTQRELAGSPGSRVPTPRKEPGEE
jgi:HAMP domain-containing protein